MPAKAPVSLDNFGSDEVRDRLNQMTIAELIAVLGSGQEHVTYATVPGWKVGDEKPSLANDDPAVMQAVGRCAAKRLRAKLPARLPVLDSVHPSTCDWCSFPLDELLKACAWSVHRSGFITSHVFEWTDTEGRKYARSGGDAGYRNPAYREFWLLPPKERERRTDAATGRKVAA